MLDADAKTANAATSPTKCHLIPCWIPNSSTKMPSKSLTKPRSYLTKRPKLSTLSSRRSSAKMISFNKLKSSTTMLSITLKTSMPPTSNSSRLWCLFLTNSSPSSLWIMLLLLLPLLLLLKTTTITSRTALSSSSHLPSKLPVLDYPPSPTIWKLSWRTCKPEWWACSPSKARCWLNYKKRATYKPKPSTVCSTKSNNSKT